MLRNFLPHVPLPTIAAPNVNIQMQSEFAGGTLGHRRLNERFRNSNHILQSDILQSVGWVERSETHQGP